MNPGRIPSAANRYLSKATEIARSPYLIIGILALLLAIQIIQNQTLLRRRFSQEVVVEPVLIGKQIVFPTLSTTDERQFELSQLERTYHVLIFFHSECQYCALDLPLWKTIYQRGASQNIDVVAITSETDAEIVAQYAREHDIPFPVLMDPERELFDQLRISGIPTKVLLSNDMRVLQIWHGWTTQHSGSSELGGMLAFLGIEPQELPQPSTLLSTNP